MSNEQSTTPNEAQIAELQAKIERLRMAQTAQSSERKEAKSQHKKTKDRSALVLLAPGFVATTVPGSLYSVILQALAHLGQLAAQDVHFKDFQENPTRESAQRLLDTIGVRRAELEQMTRANEEFREHCRERTKQLRNRAALGDRIAQGVLQNPDICTNGKWIGDLDEALAILRGARSIGQYSRGKNVRILRRVGLMFDSDYSATELRAFLYARKNHRAYRQARALLYGEG
jgi:hypothetical protein